jgi:hypothetical protein
MSDVKIGEKWNFNACKINQRGGLFLFIIESVLRIKKSALLFYVGCRIFGFSPFVSLSAIPPLQTTGK